MKPKPNSRRQRTVACLIEHGPGTARDVADWMREDIGITVDCLRDLEHDGYTVVVGHTGVSRRGKPERIYGAATPTGKTHGGPRPRKPKPEPRPVAARIEVGRGYRWGAEW